MEEFKRLCTEFKLEILEWNNSKNIVCKDGEGYKYKVDKYRLKKNKKLPHKFRQNPYAIENVQIWLKHSESPLVLVSTKYENIKANLQFTCRCHPGKIQLHSLETILNNGGKCVFNSRKQVWNRTPKETIIKECVKKDLIYQRHYQRDIDGKEHKRAGIIVEYICKKHKSKGIQSNTWANIHRYTKVCPHCIGRYKTTEDFASEIKLINPMVTILGKYTGSENKIKCECQICGHLWNPRARSLRVSGCPVCGNIKKGLSNRLTTEQFKILLFEAQPNLEIAGEYTLSHQMTKFKCSIHDYEFESIPANILNQS